MREILFRGKRKDNGKWVEGLPIKTYDTEIGKNSVDYVNPVPVVLMASSRIILEGGGDEIPFFNTGEYPIVNPETISQYTGMTDKNGKKIFEGDIIQDSNYPEYVFRIEYHNGTIIASEIHTFDKVYLDNFICFNIFEAFVIGNIHDNHELLNK